MGDATITAFPCEIIDARRAIRAALSIGLTGREAICAGQEALFKIRAGMDRNIAIHSTIQRIAQERRTMFDPDCFDFDDHTTKRSGNYKAALVSILVIQILLAGLFYWLWAA